LRSLAPRPWRRRFLRFFAVSILLATAGGLWLQRDPTARMLARHGELAGREEGPLIPVEGGIVDREVRLISTSGLEVELLVRRPQGVGDSRRPALLVLGGIRTGRTSAQLITDTHGTVVVGLSYPTHLSKIKSLADTFEARRAIVDTPAALMLGVDYVRSLPFVDPERVELLGVSLGAPFVCVAGALDERVSRVWSMYGGAAPMLLFDQGLKKNIGFAPLRRAAAWLIASISHGFTLAPEKWVPGIAPRTFMMVNADADEAIPRECVELLYRSAREPKELIWIEGGHLDKHDVTQVVRLVELVLSRMDWPGPGEGG
jgi:dienelactone hydrolase